MGKKKPQIILIKNNINTNYVIVNAYNQNNKSEYKGKTKK